MASAQFDYDDLTKIAQEEIVDALTGVIRSDVVYLQLLNPKTGAFIELFNKTGDNITMKASGIRSDIGRMLLPL